MTYIPSKSIRLGNENPNRPEHQPEGLYSNEVLPPMKPINVFLVEDSPIIRDSLIATLEELAPVKVVGNAEDELSAVQWLAQADHHCDLVIVDIFLKKGSGLGVLKAAQTPQHGQRLVVMVVLSNYATPDIRQKCLQLGADRVFDKSNDIDALIKYCCRLAAGDASDSGMGELN